MTIAEFLKLSTVELKDAGIETARLDTLILLEDALHKDRAILLAHPEQEIPTPLLADLDKKRVAREQHTPLAYIRGKATFYGREFIVNKNVLVPRPETESMIDLVKKLTPSKPHISDVGTGSGCIGITAGLEIPNSTINLYDIDELALRVARKNAIKYNLDVASEVANLLPDEARQEVILANLPYVPEQMEINKAATHEPRLALFSGADGMDHYKALWGQISGMRTKPKLIITESLPSQHHMNALLARKSGFYLNETQGFAQAFCQLD